MSVVDNMDFTYCTIVTITDRNENYTQSHFQVSYSICLELLFVNFQMIGNAVCFLWDSVLCNILREFVFCWKVAIKIIDKSKLSQTSLHKVRVSLITTGTYL